MVEERLTSSRRFDSSILMNQLIEKRSNISTRGVLVFFIFAAISIGVLLSHPSGYGVVDLSFLLVLVLLLTMFWKLFVAGEYSVFCSVFATTFFVMYWLVPLLQTNEKWYPSTMPFDAILAFQTNMIVFLFGFFFVVFRHIKLPRISIMGGQIRNLEKVAFKVFKIMFWLSIVVALLNFQTIFTAITKSRSVLSWADISDKIIRKFLYSIPLFPFLCFPFVEKSDFKSRFTFYFTGLLSLLLFLFFRNPYIEKRNALGPAYLTALFLFLSNRFGIKSNIIVAIVIIIALVFLMPVFSSLTHVRSVTITSSADSITGFLVNFNLKNYLVRGDYDPWSMLAATLAYAKDFGVTYGRQLLGVILFFVPREIWPSKPIGSGALVASNYLLVYYTIWGSNVSSPLPAEGYINFGIIGVALFGIFLGVFSRIIDRMQYKGTLKSILAYYTSFHLVFMMRGDLLSSFANLIGMAAGIYFMPLLVQRILGYKQFTMKK